MFFFYDPFQKDDMKRAGQGAHDAEQIAGIQPETANLTGVAEEKDPCKADDHAGQYVSAQLDFVYQIIEEGHHHEGQATEKRSPRRGGVFDPDGAEKDTDEDTE